MAKSAAAGRSKAKTPRKPREGTASTARAQDTAAETRALDRPAADDAERSLGRWVARGLPAGTILIAIAVGLTSSLGPALLVLAAGTLLGTIALLWASVRTLGGDAPLPVDLESIAARRRGVDDLGERKSRILRALKDLEHEHAVGKIEDADYDEISGKYREQAKDLMREMDADLEPLRERAEEIARVHLKKRGLEDAALATADEADEETAASDDDDVASDAPPRRECAACFTSNEPDATFCKRCGASLEAKDATDAPKDGDASA